MLAEQTFAKLALQNDFRWAWKNYRATVDDLVEDLGLRRVIEIGGGRSPLFSESDVRRLGIDYTANDISARELALSPDWAKKACFDVQTADAETIAPFAEHYDLVISKMVMEHVGSFERAYRTIHSILKPGGIGLAFHPTLYALPFVVNLLIPERLSDTLLKAVFKDRSDNGEPKFPARYSGCRVSGSVTRKLREIGFARVEQIPFYGHDYYRKFPGVGAINHRVAEFARQRDMTFMATYAYTLVQK